MIPYCDFVAASGAAVTVSKIEMRRYAILG